MVLAGLIYQRGKRLPHADIAKAVNRLKRIAKALRWYGAGIMIFGLAGIVWVWGPLLISNFKFQILNQFQIFNYINLLFWFYIASVLIIIFVYDLKHYIIPDKVLFPAIAITFLYQIFTKFDLIVNFLIAAVIASGFFLTIFLISKGRWMGFGDVKLAVLMGFLLGVPNVMAALFLAFFFGAIISLILLVFHKKKLKSEIPFGPFLILGTFLAMLWGQQIILWYFNIFYV